MNKRLTAVLIAGLLSQSAYAAGATGTSTGIQPGEKSFGILAQFVSTDAFDMTLVLASLDLALDSQMTVGGTVMVTSTDYGDTLSLGGRVRYHIPSPQAFVPYVGAGAAYSDYDFDSYLELIGEVGLLQPISENVDLDYNFALHIPTDSDYDTVSIASVGLKVTF